MGLFGGYLKYGSQYWIYLVPHEDDGVFNTQEIQMFPDPYRTIFKNSANWYKTVDGYTVWEKPN